MFLHYIDITFFALEYFILSHRLKVPYIFPYTVRRYRITNYSRVCDTCTGMQL